MSGTNNEKLNGVTDGNNEDVFSFDDVLFGGRDRKAEAQQDGFDKLLSDLSRAKGRTSAASSSAAPQSKAAQPGSYDLDKFGGAASSLSFDTEAVTAWLDSSFDETAAPAKKTAAQQAPRQTKTVPLGGRAPASEPVRRAQPAPQPQKAAQPAPQAKRASAPAAPERQSAQRSSAVRQAPAAQAPARKAPAIEYDEHVYDYPRAEKSEPARAQAPAKPAPAQPGKSGGSSNERKNRISKAILCVAIPVILLCSGYLIYDNLIAPRMAESNANESNVSSEATKTPEATVRENNLSAEPGSEETAVSSEAETPNADPTTTKAESGNDKVTTGKTDNITEADATAAENSGRITEKPTSKTEKETTSKKQNTTRAPETTTTAKPKSNYEYAYAGFDPQPADMSKGIEGLLVNRFYILPEGYKPPLGQTTDGSYLHRDVVPHYNAMVKQAAKENISLIPVSGYRSIETQRANFERKINLYQNTYGYDRTKATQKASEIVLMPRTSEHNAGLAMDFGTNGNYTLDENFANTAAYRWLDQHAAEYGFILRYPANKTGITYVTYEPWHWRYVGKDLAPKIKASGLVLEEYFGKVNH